MATQKELFIAHVQALSTDIAIMTEDVVATRKLYTQRGHDSGGANEIVAADCTPLGMNFTDFNNIMGILLPLLDAFLDGGDPNNRGLAQKLRTDT